MSADTYVDSSIEHAFRVFTETIGSWWNPGHHLLDARSRMTFEPRAGGHIIDRYADGRECRWARVLAVSPHGTHVVLTHSHLDRHGDGWESMRDAVTRGWDLGPYAEVASDGLDSR